MMGLEDYFPKSFWKWPLFRVTCVFFGGGTSPAVQKKVFQVRMPSIRSAFLLGDCGSRPTEIPIREASILKRGISVSHHGPHQGSWNMTRIQTWCTVEGKSIEFTIPLHQVWSTEEWEIEWPRSASPPKIGLFPNENRFYDHGLWWMSLVGRVFETSP